MVKSQGYHSQRIAMLEAGKEYLSRKGGKIVDLAYSHTKDGVKIFTGILGGAAQYWREDGRALTEYYSPSHTLDKDIIFSSHLE